MSLRSFLQELEKANELIKVKEEASVKHEIAAVLKEYETSVMLFENVKESKVPVVAGVCGTRGRICRALNVSEEELYGRLIEAMRAPKRPKVVKEAPVREVIEGPDLSKLPILTHYERDMGPYITSGVVFAKFPDGRGQNASIHRMLVLDRNRLAIRLVPRHLYYIFKLAKERGEALEVAIAIGLHPAVMLAASSSPPFGRDEMEVANALLNDKLELTPCEKVDILVPSEAEVVLEGRILPDVEAEERMVDITELYDVVRKQPVIELVNVMRREDCIYQALLPSGPEHKLLMGLPREAMIWESVLNVVPKVKAVNLTAGGCGWLHAVISIEKQTDGDAKNALLAAFGAHPSLKLAIVVDTDVNAYDLREVEWALATRFQAGEDLVLIPRARGSTLDPSADQETGLTTKVGMDATKPLREPKERFERAAIPIEPRAAEVIEGLRKLVTRSKAESS